MTTRIPKDGMTLNASTTLRPGTYYLPKGISITADNITVQAHGVHLVGNKGNGVGISLHARKNVTLEGIELSHFHYGIRAENCINLTIQETTIRATPTVPPATIPLNVWQPLASAYSAACLLVGCNYSTLCNNDLQHNMNGISLYDCNHMNVRRNCVNYAAGFGIHLNGTSDSLCEDNAADFCTRYVPPDASAPENDIGMIGAYAVGFLILNGSNRNVFRRNTARMCGDSFFLCSYEENSARRADDNIFEENDGSWTPGIAFEATFSRGTIYRNNTAYYSKYGFWLGYSWDALLENNRVCGNRLAGIAVENGRHCTVQNNAISDNAYGILLWSDWAHTRYETSGPGAHTSAHWLIAHNTFMHNRVALRIAAEQNQGTEPLPRGKGSAKKRRPHHHEIAHNTFRDNPAGIDLYACDHTHIHDNLFTGIRDFTLQENACTHTNMQT